MIYLTNDDLKADSIQRYIDESTADYTDAIDKAEEKAISLAKTYLSGRYDVATIFDEDSPVIDGLLVDILVKITLHKIFGRNAARRLPTDIKEEYDWAVATLEKINSGKLTIQLPKATDESGNTKSTSMFGSNRNDNYFI
ncbi:hypothetical protein NBRC110019_07550 [Neptunitalea chrysea]|uniref:DUF1320 domain-containing protein n=1 Tax=Neptunitalea chrysea TaxID=1647581 RepID=A0A9W6B3F1_9FLAO|nr:phage protein Gp36 family protein [Neptunitalea chrysea]GLB51716.1 hypothetical protein NBRC110019_07550 [Neptunitalea chrysea]